MSYNWSSLHFSFAVDFTNQLKDGCLCLYSIKNPAFPEYSVMTDSPIIALDVYKETPYMICIGKILGYLIVNPPNQHNYTFYNFKRYVNHDTTCVKITLNDFRRNCQH